MNPKPEFGQPEPVKYLEGRMGNEIMDGPCMSSETKALPLHRLRACTHDKVKGIMSVDRIFDPIVEGNRELRVV